MKVRLAMPLTVVLVAAGVALGVWLWQSAPGEPPEPEPQAALARARAEPPRLVDATREWGLRRPTPAPLERLLPETLAGACALFDADADGDVDVLLTHGRSWLRAEREGAPTLALYKNDGGGHFAEATEGSGLEAPIRALGAAVADFDGDGHLDVFVTAAGTNRLLAGRGDCTFADVTATAGVGGDPRDWSTGCAWVDHDADGDLDLFVSHLCRYEGEPPGDRSGTPVRLSDLPPTWPTLWKNDGDRSFADASAAAGVQLDDRVTGESGSRFLGVTAVDLDGSGRGADLVLAGFGGEDRHLFGGLGARFVDATDVRHLGLDALGNPAGSTGVAIALGEGGLAACAITRAERGALALHVPVGRSRTEDVGAAVLADGGGDHSYYGVDFLDLDLDGLSDLCLVGGSAPGLTPSRLVSGRLDVRLGLAGSGRGTHFAGAAVATGELPLSPDSRGLGHADLDGDGDLDLLVTSAFGPHVALRNDRDRTDGWVRVTLRGRAPNTAAIGAALTWCGARGTQRRAVTGSGGYLGASELTQTFAMGPDPATEELEIVWPDGTVTMHAGLEAGRVHEIQQP